MLKKCPKCGTVYQDDVKFCINCGMKLTYEVPAHTNYEESSNTWKWAAAIIAVVLIGGGAFWWFNTMSSKTSADVSLTTDSEQVEDVAQDTLSEESQQVVIEEQHTTEEVINGPTVLLRANSASGNCDSDQGVVYKASNLIDGNIRTCWALDIRGKANYKPQGFGPVRFSINCSRLDYIVVYNGYQKNDRNYWGNPRAKTIAMYNADNMSSPILDSSLNDTKEGQQVYAIDNSANRHISEILMYFPGDDFFYPAEWNDLSISEIKFYGVK